MTTSQNQSSEAGLHEDSANVRYWPQDALAMSTRQAFEASRLVGDARGMRSVFFQVTHFYAKTLNIWRQALERSRERLATTALENLIQLDAALGAMHLTAPDVVPLAVPLTRELRDHFLRGLIVRVLDEAPLALKLGPIMERLHEFQLLGQVRSDRVEAQLETLLSLGIATITKSGFKRTSTVYNELSTDESILEILLGRPIADSVARSGMHGVLDVIERRDEFVRVFSGTTGMSPELGALFVNVAIAFSGEQAASHTKWRHLDLIGSRIPRPYQRTAFAMLRGMGYQATLLEATTGSGKTLIGMMCIQDWLRRMESGQSILILVPTNNYQQQWVRELCFHHGVLQLAPEVVFSGTVADLRRLQQRSGRNPAVFVLTYASLAQLCEKQQPGATDPVQDFIKSFGVEFVVLDEAHKVVDDLESNTTQVVRQLTGKLTAGGLSGLIGFSGTLAIPKRRFANVGLRVVHRVPIVELMGTGYVAPFAEFGVPYALSVREQTVRSLLEEYRSTFREYLALCDLELVRREFKKIPIEQRTQMASRFLGMYVGRPDAAELLRHRVDEWEQVKTLGLGNAGMVLIVQVAASLSEFGLVLRRHWPKLKELIQRATVLRNSLAELCSLDDIADVLDIKVKLGEKPASSDFARLLRPKIYPETARQRFREMTNSSLTGVYLGVRQWGRHLGEGRVAAVKAIITAEQRVREVTGTIVFDDSRAIRWGDKAVRAGFEGVGGMFANLLGEAGIVPIAALSKEIYLPVDDENPFVPRIANFIHETILLGEFNVAIGELLLSGLNVSAEIAEKFRGKLSQSLTQWLAEIVPRNFARDGAAQAANDGSTARPVSRANWNGVVDSVFRPLRSEFGHVQAGVSKRAAARLRTRLHRRNVNLKSLMKGFFDYVQIASQCLHSHRSELKQADGSRHPFRVIPIPNGRRRQLMYDLIARLVDDVELPFNVVIVSDWARSGWNVVKPNLLIDATATRDVTAWQQLRGRALRSLKSWNVGCYRLLMALRCEPSDVPSQQDADDRTSVSPFLTDQEMQLLQTCSSQSISERVRADGITALPVDARLSVAVELVQQNNKVTHIYELLNAGGREPQLEFDTAKSRWVRRASIAEKHHGQLNVELESMTLVTESVDSMLLCTGDPEHASAQAIEELIRNRIADSDAAIIKTWLKPGFSRLGEEDIGDDTDVACTSSRDTP